MSTFYFKFSGGEDAALEEAEVELSDERSARLEAIRTLAAICGESKGVPVHRSLEVRNHARDVVFCMRLYLAEEDRVGC